MNMMMSMADAMLRIASVILALMITCPRDVEAVFGIPEFLEMGKCAKVPLKEGFDPVKYSGLWFDIESVPNEYQHTKKCVTQNYSWMNDQMNVATRGLTTVDKKVRQGALMKVEKSRKPAPNPAHMTVEAAGVPAAPYQIISSDYRTYSCVYSCLEYFGFRAEFFWIFGRTPTIPVEKIKLCHDTFESLKVDYRKMVPIIQGDSCPYAEKLDDMLEESEQHLLKVLGPYVPTESVPTLLPVTTPKTQSGQAVEEELKEIKEIVEEERKIVQELEVKVLLNSDKAGTTSKKNTQKNSDDLNSGISASSSASMFLLILSAFVTTLLQH